MKTERIDSDLDRAAEILSRGGLCAVPTETVYGLAANAMDDAAVEEIFRVKGRPQDKPLSLMVDGPAAAEHLCGEIPLPAKALMGRYWPGPLTIVLPALPGLAERALCGGQTVGLRCPDSEKTLAVLEKCGFPLAAPSANPSGENPPVSADEVLSYFDGQIPAVIDGGKCKGGVASTIYDMSCRPFRILRNGPVSEEELLSSLVSSMTIVGITGGTGCGKTTALNTLRDRGALIIDCDEVYHDLTVSSAEMRRELTQRYGDVYDENGLNRKKLGAVVFNDPDALSDLNVITHKYVSGEVERLLRDHAAMGGTLAAVDAIGLLGSSLEKMCTFTVAVTAPEEMRARRIMAREGISFDYALSRIHAQRSNSYFEENCTHTLQNDSTREAFEDKCKKFFSEVLSHE